jgi:type VI secretion system protein ImpH
MNLHRSPPTNRQSPAGSEPAGDELAALLERDPGRFDPVTALRVAQASGEDGLEITAPAGVVPAALAVSGFGRRGGRRVIRSALASLTGPLGSLPPTYNDLILREERNRARALSAFFDLFGTRMSELFADACEKYRLARSLRWGGDRRRNRFIRTLLSLAGFGTRGLVPRAGVEEDLLLRFSGFFANRTRNAASLGALLADVTGLPVAIEQFRGRWLTIPPEELSRIGQSKGLQLGVNATAGASLRDFSGGFRIVIGPVHYADYLRLSPDGAAVREISALTRLYVGHGLDFDIQVILKKEDVPFSVLGQAGDPPRLGWNSWARTGPALKDSADAVIKPAPSSVAGGSHAA